MNSLAANTLPFAIITGTGATELKDWVDGFEEERAENRFGSAWLQRCRKGRLVFWHVNRHCASKPIAEQAYRLAHLITGREAYVLALAERGVRSALALSCVGAADRNLEVGSVVIPGQYLTPPFCALSFSDSMPDEAGPEFYREWPRPFNPGLNRLFYDRCLGLGLRSQLNGTLEIVRGPQFETMADMDDKRQRGVTIVGMATALPECALAGELGIAYSGAFLVTDHPDRPTTQADVEAVSRQYSPKLFQAAVEVIRSLSGSFGQPIPDASTPVAGLREKFGLPQFVSTPQR